MGGGGGGESGCQSLGEVTSWSRGHRAQCRVAVMAEPWDRHGRFCLCLSSAEDLVYAGPPRQGYGAIDSEQDFMAPKRAVTGIFQSCRLSSGPTVVCLWPFKVLFC